MTLLLLALAVKSVAILAVTALSALCLRRASAAARHLVWLAAFVGILMLPLLSQALPGWKIATKAAFMSAPYPSLRSFFTARHLSPASQEKGQTERFLPSPAKRGRVGEAGEGADSADASNITSIPRTFPTHGFPTLRPQAVALAAYLIGLILVLLRWIVGLARVRRVGAKAGLPLADELARAVGVRRPIAIRLAPHAAPMTWGVIRPVILLPADAPRWPAERLRVVLLHELAHVRRGDWLAQALTALACAAYWFLPPVWLAARQLRLESERACDDVVLSVGVPAPDYARHLLEVLRAMKPIKTLAPAALPMASPSTLETRVRAILSVRANRRGATRPAVLLVSLLAAALLVPLAALRPVARAQAAPPKATALPPFVIVIDAGHGGRDSGAVVNGVREKDWNLAFARRLRDALTTRGATVYLTRDSDTFLPVLERPKIARNAHADVFISLHCDAARKESERSGVIVFHHDGPQNAALALRLATAVSASGKTVSRVQNDTSRFPSGFGVLRLAAMPAVLLECGDLNDLRDFSRLQNPEAQKAFLDTLAAALCQNAPQTESRWKKSLPGGGSVTLFAVFKDKKTWKPDGTPLKKFSIAGSAVFTHPQGQSSLGLIFAVSDPTKSIEAFDVKTLDPAKPDVFSIKAASGQWRTKAIVSGSASAKTHTSLMGAARERRKTTRVEIMTPVALLEQQYQVIAIDKAGKMHEARGYISGKSANGRQGLTAVWDARNLAAQNVRECMFQTRPYQWVTFDNVALQPN